MEELKKLRGLKVFEKCLKKNDWIEGLKKCKKIEVVEEIDTSE